ncbi:phospholipase D family protein [Lacihabitans sp. LS3-19]|uniref:phospholipase D-like domain-containing protein n=1 Tax=Lacihabitans sp. LS3-19 TaxID=2487335 RepID=UPI0020CFB3D7|nr:phospholipase D family protein [Lacihabitans sp. LS3-19]MCP9770918.1 phospholipase D family protein [Lacihabitans sp. LS3-19]
MLKIIGASFLCIVLFSCSKETKKEESKIDFCSKIHQKEGGQIQKYLEGFSEKMKNQTAAYVLEDGGGSLVTRAWFTENSEKSIDIQYFIFSTDNVGLIACDYLIRAADRGVKVRLLVDDMMVDSELEDILSMEAHPNIEIKIYNPGVNLGKNIFKKIGKFVSDYRNANLRMHNKTFIVDKKVAITGGRNIADEYFDYDHEYNFRDRDILLIGKSVSQINDSFVQFWESELSVPVSKLSADKIQYKGDAYEKLHQYACNPDNFWPQVRKELNEFPATFQKIIQSEAIVWSDNVRFVSDMPGKNEGKNGLEGGGQSTKELIGLINGAKTSIDINTPYLITTELGKSVFRNAVKRGVKVRILTNSMSSTDNAEAFSGYQRDRVELLRTGIEIYEFKPDAAERFKVMTGALQKKMNFTPIFGLHAKSMVIDGHIAVVGTFNLDPRSANLNTECFALVDSEKLSEGILKNMNEDFQTGNSWKITPNFNPDKEVNLAKRLKVKSRRVVPKSIL